MTTESIDDDLLEDRVSRVLSERCRPETRRLAEVEGWAPALWGVLASAGYTSVGIPEEAGGVGGSLLDAATVVRLAGKFAVPLPLAECSGLLAGWLVTQAGFSLPEGPLSVAVPRRADTLSLDSGRLNGTLSWVPWGRQVANVIALVPSPAGDCVVLLEQATAVCQHGTNLAGDARDRLTFADVPVPAERVCLTDPGLRFELACRGALSRSLLMAGAMEAVADLTVEYAGQRHQFGRPISTFQAVAHRLVRLVSETALASVASEVATRRFNAVGLEAVCDLAAAKATVSRAASEVANHAHQIHGAVGMTQEYPLHDFTRRLWVWRQEWGSEATWARRLGEDAMNAGAEDLWPRVATNLVKATGFRKGS